MDEIIRTVRLAELECLNGGIQASDTNKLAAIPRKISRIAAVLCSG